MKRMSGYISAFMSVIFIALSVLPAAAAQPQPGGSSGLSITPRKNYIIKPGQTITDKLNIGNLDTVNNLTISLKMIDFTYTDQSGTPKLAIADNVPQTTWSLKSFAKLPQNVSIPAGQSKTVEYTITMPSNIGAGSYYSAIMYQASGANGGNVALNASGVTLAFVSVPGQVNEKMTLQKFGAYNAEVNGGTGSYVFLAINGAPKAIAYTLKNEGNVFESPAGNVVLKDMFGHQVANVTTNPNSSLALLGQSRLFTSCIKTVQETVQALGGTSKNSTCVDPKLKPGRYTASLDVFYGQNGNQTHEITAVSHFWYLPIWFIVLVVVLIALISYGIWWGKRKLQRALKGTAYKANRGTSRRGN